VFGKPGSGKSTLSKALAAATGIPLYQLGSILYENNGELVPPKGIHLGSWQDTRSRELVFLSVYIGELTRQ